MTELYKQIAQGTLDFLSTIPTGKSITFVGPTGSSGKFILMLKMLELIDTSNPQTQVLILCPNKHVSKNCNKYLNKVLNSLNLEITSGFVDEDHPTSFYRTLFKREQFQILISLLPPAQELTMAGILALSGIKCVMFINGNEFEKMNESELVFLSKRLNNPVYLIRSIDPIPKLKKIFTSDYHDITV